MLTGAWLWTVRYEDSRMYFILPRPGRAKGLRAAHGEANGYFAATGRPIHQRNGPAVPLDQQFADVEAKSSRLPRLPI